MGFIGSNFIRHMLARYGDITIINLDKLSYGSNSANLADIPTGPRYRFVKGDINDMTLVGNESENAEAIVNIAAETHVDRSISNPRTFLEANTDGVLNLLEACRLRDLTFLQVSTDEVYGAAGELQAFKEGDPLNPSSP
jgi:dTDP-glucose 4,6-dehydratase